MVEVNLVVGGVPEALLACVTVTADHLEHHLSRDVTRMDPPLLRFGGPGLRCEEDRADVAEDVAAKL